MPDLPQCTMYAVQDGPGEGVEFDQDSGQWLLPCSEPVAGLAHEDGRPYCRWHLELMDEPPLMWFVVTAEGIEGPVEAPES